MSLITHTCTYLRVTICPPWSSTSATVTRHLSLWFTCHPGPLWCDEHKDKTPLLLFFWEEHWPEIKHVKFNHDPATACDSESPVILVTSQTSASDFRLSKSNPSCCFCERPEEICSKERRFGWICNGSNFLLKHLRLPSDESAGCIFQVLLCNQMVCLSNKAVVSFIDNLEDNLTVFFYLSYNSGYFKKSS